MNRHFAASWVPQSTGCLFPKLYNSISGFDFCIVIVSRMWLSIYTFKFYQNWTNGNGVWHRIDVSIWRLRRRKSISGFMLLDVTQWSRHAFTDRILTRYHDPRLRYYCLRDFWKLTVIILEFYFRFRFFSPARHSAPAIKFYPKQTIHIYLLQYRELGHRKCLWRFFSSSGWTFHISWSRCCLCGYVMSIY